MDSADVFALRQEGLTYAELVAAQGVDLETLIDLIAAQHESTLQAQFDAGLLSPDQVTWMQAEMHENCRARLTRLWEVGSSLGYYTSAYGYNTLNQSRAALGMTPDPTATGDHLGRLCMLSLVNYWLLAVFRPGRLGLLLIKRSGY